MKRNLNILLLVLLVAALGLAYMKFGVDPSKRALKQEVGAEVVGPDDALMKSRIQATDKMIQEGRVNEAQQALSQIAADYPDTEYGEMAQTRLDEIGLEAYFSALSQENSAVYEVRPGDSLSRIAKNHNTTVGTIKMANNLKKDTIWPYQKLKIMTDPWSVVVDKSSNIMMLKAAEKVVKTYQVATGSEKSTPVGEFKIINRLVDPTWYYEGKVVPANSPDNPLGTRWLGFDLDGYGIHGTSEPDSIGGYVTLGCIRLRNEEVEELFELLPVGTMVKVLE